MKRDISVWLPLTWSPVGTWPTTQACALTWNLTSSLLVCRLTLNPLSQPYQEGHEPKNFVLLAFISLTTQCLLHSRPYWLFVIIDIRHIWISLFPFVGFFPFPHFSSAPCYNFFSAMNFIFYHEFYFLIFTVAFTFSNNQIKSCEQYSTQNK